MQDDDYSVERDVLYQALLPIYQTLDADTGEKVLVYFQPAWGERVRGQSQITAGEAMQMAFEMVGVTLPPKYPDEYEETIAAQDLLGL